MFSEKLFAITNRFPFAKGMCEEYQIVEKIRKNEEGFFDFSKLLIDIGAEDGNYSMLLDFDRNYCFEPNKRMCCLIYTNMYLRNKVKNTEVYNVALGKSDNETMVFNGFAEEGSHTYKGSMYLCENGVEVINKKTLDSYGITNVGLIKTDTEGFDLDVLIGGMETIKNNDYPPILFENWAVGDFGQTQEEHDRILDFLGDIGYYVYENWGDSETHLAVKMRKYEK